MESFFEIVILLITEIEYTVVRVGTTKRLLKFWKGYLGSSISTANTMFVERFRYRFGIATLLRSPFPKAAILNLVVDDDDDDNDNNNNNNTTSRFDDDERKRGLSP